MDRNDKVAISVLGLGLLATVLCASASALSRIDVNALAIAVVSTFIAAFAGTWGAQLVAQRASDRRSLLDEIRAVNSAIALTFSITNTFVTTKKQHIKGIFEDYKDQSESLLVHAIGVALHYLPPNSPIRYKANLLSLTMPYCPIEALEETVRQRVSADLKALVVLTPLAQSVVGLTDSVRRRNLWIEEFKRLPPDAHELKAYRYFGLLTPDGHQDVSYPGYVDALFKQTDDCIAFSYILGKALIKHAKVLAKQYGTGAPKIAEPSFEKSEQLMPDMSLYSDWLL